MSLFMRGREMKNVPRIIAALAIIITTGCSSRHQPPPPLDTSMDLNAREPEKLPFVDPALPSGDIKDVKTKEIESFEKAQHERLRQQQKEVDDLRRQKFQDGYYKQRYPNATE
jgi:hypothetical protein